MSMNKNNEGKSSHKQTLRLFAISVPVVYLTIYLFTGKFNGISDITSLMEFVKNFIKTEAINLVFVIAMFAIIILDANKARKKLLNITDGLEEYTSMIRNGKDIFALKDDDSFLGNCLKEYNNDRKNNHDISPDIADYINEQIVADATHQTISNHIPGIMTSLGILGTFIGLTLGLETFNPGDLNSTTNLMNGIKTAFYTSIFGIIASIIHNHFYQSDIEKNNKALEDFYGVFYSKIAAEPDISFYNKVAYHNEHQVADISKALADNITHAISLTINPIIEKLNTSIDKYIIDAVNAQSSTLEKIVNNFMDKLNKSMDDQFYSLSHSIRDMCTWQNESVEKSKEILDLISDTTINLSEINTDMKEVETIRGEINKASAGIISNANEYNAQFRTYLGELNSWIQELKIETKNHAECSKKITEYADSRQSEIADIIGRVEHIVQELGSYNNQTQRALEQYRDDNQKLLTVLNGITDQFNTYVKESNKGLENGIIKYESISQGLQKNTSDMTKNMEKIMGEAERMIQTMENSVNEMSVLIKSTSEIIKQIKRD